MVAIVTGSGLGLENSSKYLLGSNGQLGSASLGRGDENVTVNAATGNLILQNQDEFVTGLGLDLSLTRTYNSLGDFSDENGDNWLNGLSKKVAGLTGTVNTAGSTITRTNWDGTAIVYTWSSADSAYVTTGGAGASDKLTYSANVWTWTDGDTGITELYDNANGGRITSARDTDLNAITYTYTNGLLTGVTNQNGEYLTLTYTSGRISQIYGATGTAQVVRTQYGYDAQGRLSTVYVDHTPLDALVADGNAYVTTYTYDGSSTRVASISQTDGSKLQFTYTLYGADYRVTGITQTVAPAWANDPLITRVTTIAYDTAARTTTITDPLGNATTLAYDTSNRLITITAPPAASGMSAQVTQFAYNANGDVTSMTDPSGQVTVYSYDARGNLTQVRDAAGNTIDRTYGTSNELLTETHYLVPDPDGGGAGNPSTPVQTRFAYDSELHLCFVVSAEGDVTEYRYNASGLRTSTIRYPGNAYTTGGTITKSGMDTWVGNIADKSNTQRIDYTYDSRGNIATETIYSAVNSAGAGLTTSDYSRTTTAYNWNGTLYTRLTNRSPAQETFYYDGLARITSAYGLNGYQTSITYADADATTTVKLANGLIQTSMYNRAGELVAYTESDGTNLAPNSLLANGTQGWYQSNVTRVSGSSSDPLPYFWQQTGTGYGEISMVDALPLPTGTTFDLSFTAQASATGKLLKVGIWWYNSSGGLIGDTPCNTYPTDTAFHTYEFSITRPANAASFRVYFSGEPGLAGSKFGDIRFRLPDSGTPELRISTYRYDSLGNLRIERDATGRLTHHLYDKVGRRTADITADGALTEYKYDADDRLIATISYINKMSTAQLNSLVDASGNPTNVTVASIRPTLDNAKDNYTWRIYDNADRLIQTIDGTGAYTIYAYDGDSRLISTRSGVNTLPAAFVSGYRTTPPTSLQDLGPFVGDRFTRNFYDNDGRLVGVLDAAGGLSQIFFDEAGQKIREIGYATVPSSSLWVSGTFAQLLSSAGTSSNDRRVDYVYDQRGFLKFTVDGSAQPTEFVYNADGQIIRSVAYAGAIASSSSYSLSYVQSQLTSTGLATNANNRISRSVYDDTGNLVYTIDAMGGTTVYKYDVTNTLISTRRHSSLYTTAGDPTASAMATWAAAQGGTQIYNRFIYDVSGRLVYEVDGENYVTEHQYDGAGRILKDMKYVATYSVGDSTTQAQLAAQIGALPSTAVVTTYAYDSAGRLTDVTEQIDTSTTTVTHFVYNGLGQATDTTVAYGTSDAATTRRMFDAAGRVTSETFAYGMTEATTTSYTYDGLGNLLTTTDGRNNVWIRTYDTLGHMLTFRAPHDGLDYPTTTYQYNVFGETVKVTDPRGNATYHYYDKLGRETVSRDAEDYVTETSYDVFGGVSAVTRRYNKANNAASVTTLPTYVVHAKDATTSFEYDKCGRLTKVTDAEGFFEQYTLNAFGFRTQVINKLGGTITNTYDRRGLLTDEVLPMASYNANGTTQASSVTNHYEYDSRGNRTKMVEAQGLTEQRTTLYFYDKRDQLIETRGDQVSVLNATNFNTTSNATPSETLKYDRRGNVIERVAVNGARTLCYYDDLDRKIVELNALGAYSALTYDANGNVLTSRTYATTVTLPASAGGSPPAAPAGTWRETTFTYDNLNQLKSQNIAGLKIGSSNGTSANGTATIEYSYDAAGNNVLMWDGNDGLTTTYFDKLGRKIAQVDQANYYTTWTYDAEGNVLSERRYATVAPGPIAWTTQPTVPTSADDRVTDFTYDRNGRRLTEIRSGVTAWTVNTSNGTLTQSATTSTITYTYNGLGEVTRKTEATGDYVDYTYDSTGRLTKETRAPYTDFLNASVRPTTDYYYNGLNNLMRTRTGDTATNAADRITTYAYGAGGRLSSMTNAAGDVYTYFYDVSGNVLRESYDRKMVNRANTATYTTVSEGVLYTRDLLGRVTQQTVANWSGGSWNKGTIQGTSYNAFGEVDQRGIWEGGTAMWQQQFAYDNAGRLWRTNSGDGVWRYFIYDAAGNQVISIESEGTDLANKTIDQVLAITGSTVGSTYVDGINATLASFDGRGMQIQTREMQRQLDATAARYTLTYARTYTAFGEVKSETDARNYTTDYTYNTMGRLIQKQSPTVNWTSESGAVASARPTETSYYDLSGRLVATKDPNNNTVSRTLLAGTGYGGSNGLITAQFFADGTEKTFYDVFGDARILRNAQNQDETYTYDAMGRIITETHFGALLTETYAYDVLGQRIKHYNSFLTASNVEITDYDKRGRVTAVVSFGGDETTTSYSWSNTLATTGMGTFGGWTETTTYANSKTMIVKSDIFGHDTQKTDLGGNVFTYGYDYAGRFVSTTRGAETITNAFFNTGLVQSLTKDASNSATYTYDGMGNRLTEVSVKAGVNVQNATATYDAIGRTVTWSEAGGSVTPGGSISYEYDLASNIRRQLNTVRYFDGQGNIGSPSTDDDWYRYDARNRLVLEKGVLGAGAIGYDGNSVGYTYDAAGRRASSIRWKGDVFFPGFGTITQWHTESYTYQTDGALDKVHLDEDVTTILYDQWGNPMYAVPGHNSWDIADYTYDAMGRITRQKDYSDGVTVIYDRQITYNSKGQITTDLVINKQGADTYQTTTTNSYGTGTGYALGAVTSFTNANLKNGNSQPGTSTTNTFYWYDGAVSNVVSYDSDTGSSGNPIWTSTYAYNTWGDLGTVTITDGRPRTVTFTNDMYGQALRRDEADNNGSNGDPHEAWYRFNGRQVAFTGNNGTLDTSYRKSIDNRQLVQGTGAFKFGATSYSGYSDFTQATEQLTSYSQGSSGGAYTVKAGDTLQSIALATWGDANLWYKIAEANGLTANNALIDGQQLILPRGVLKGTHNASTIKPYDPSDSIGDLSPTSRKPPKKNRNCGILGSIILIAVAAAVTALTQGMFGTLLGPVLGPMATAATASAASQGFGVATGLQDKFSWKAVAMTAITAGAAAGLDQIGAFARIGLGGATTTAGRIAQAAGRYAVTDGVSQGLAVATGLQRKFDWAGVASAGAIGAVTTGAGLALDATPLDSDKTFANQMRNAGAFTAGAIAGAAAKSLINGDSFGDNLRSVLPQAIGFMAGNLLRYGAPGVQETDREPRKGDVKNAPVFAEGGEMAAPGVTQNSAVDPVVGEGGGQIGSQNPESFIGDFDAAAMLLDADAVIFKSPFDLPADEDVLRSLNEQPKTLPKWLLEAMGLTARGGVIAYGVTAQATGAYEAVPLYGTDVLLTRQAEAFGGYSMERNGEVIGQAISTSLDGVYAVATKDGVEGTFNGANAFVVRTVPGTDQKIGFGVSIQTQREAEIYHEGIAGGWSADKINNAIAKERAASGNDGGDFKIGDMRRVGGIAFTSGGLSKLGERWLADGYGFVPQQVADRLRGRAFSNFNAFRRAFWMAVADSPELSANFQTENLERMRNGKSPFVRPDQRYRSKSTFQIHHANEIRFGGSVYDMSNMVVLSPLLHNNLHYRKK